MGNSCCGNRIPKENTNKSQLTNEALPEIIQQDLKNPKTFNLPNKDEQNIVETYKETKTCDDKTEQPSKTSQVPSRLTPSNFPYTLSHCNSLTNIAKSIVAKNFSPVDSSSEKILGHLPATNHQNQSQKLVLTNYALYTIDHKNDLNVSSKVLISSICFIFVSDSQNQVLIHTTPNVHSSDLWLCTEKLQDFFNYLQSTHYSLTQSCIPYKTVALDTFKDLYNAFPSSMLVKTSDELFKKAFVSIFPCIDLTENLEFVVKCKGDCVGNSNVFLALSNKALYALSQEFCVENRIEYENINSLLVSPGMEKVVVMERDGEKRFYFVGNKFLTELQKNFSVRVKRKLRMNIYTEIEEYSKIDSGSIKI